MELRSTMVTNRFIGDRAGNYFKRDDPYFEATEDTPGVYPPCSQSFSI